MLQVATSFQNVKLTLRLMEQLFTQTLCMLRTLALIRFTDTRYLKQYNVKNGTNSILWWKSTHELLLLKPLDHGFGPN